MRTPSASRSIKEECLNRLIPLGERHFRHAVAEYVAHYHCERNHQGLANEQIAGTLDRMAVTASSWRRRSVDGRRARPRN